MMIRKSIILFCAILLPAMAEGQSVYDLLLQARALNDSGKPGKAAELISSSSSLNSDYRLLLMRSDARFLAGDYNGASVDCLSANKLSPGSGEYGLARIYAIKGDAASSLQHLELSMRSSFKKSEKEIMLDPALSRIENTPEWRSFWKKDWYTVPERSLSEIEYYLKAGKSSEASEVLSGLQRDYNDSQAAEYASSVVKIAAGKTADAVKTLTGLIAQDQSNYKYLRTLADAQLKGSNPAGATSAYSKLINMEVVDPELFLLRAECYQKTGERDKALSDINKYLSLYPEDKNALRMAGITESSAGNNIKALEYFSENLRLHPGDPQCFIDRGNSYFISRSWQWAEKDYSMSLDLDPGNPEVWLNKGITLINTGKTEDACHDFRRALALGNKKAADYISRYCIK